MSPPVLTDLIVFLHPAGVSGKAGDAEAPAIHLGDHNDVAGFWLQLNSNPAGVAWRENQWLESQSVSLTPLSLTLQYKQVKGPVFF